jgi:hypothetical protein
VAQATAGVVLCLKKQVGPTLVEDTGHRGHLGTDAGQAWNPLTASPRTLPADRAWSNYVHRRTMRAAAR